MAAQTKGSFTLQQVLSAPFANQLTAAPVGNLFAWVEDAEGRHNLYVGGRDVPARALTHNTEDDGQDITQLAWAPDGSAIAYVYGAPTGADGKPANPAHLQRATPVQVMVQSLTPDAQPVVIGEGRAPLFSRDGRSLLFVREGQIWMAASTLPAATPPCPASATICDLPVNGRRFQGPRQLVFDRGSASSLTLSPDGNTLAFLSRRREANEPSHSFLALYSMTAHTISFPAPSTSNDSAPAFSPDGKQMAWIRNPFTDVPEFANPRTSATPWSIQLIDLATNITRTAYSPQPNERGSVLPDLSTGAPYLLFADAHHLVFYSEAAGWMQLYSLNPNAETPPYLLNRADLGEVDGASLGDGRVFFSSNFDGYDPLDRDRRHIFSYALNDVEELGVEQATSGTGIETHPAGSGAGVATLISDAASPMQPALITLSPGSRVVALTPLHPGLLPKTYPAGAFVTPRQVLFDSSDGVHLHSQLFLPKRDADSSAALRNDKLKKHPALIFVHGGPKRQMLSATPAWTTTPTPTR